MHEIERLRGEYKQIRRAIPTAQKAEYDLKIFETLVTLEEYIKSDIVLTYVSTKYETDTARLIRHAEENGKKTAVPKVLGDGLMVFEPHVEPLKNAVCIVPAIVYDKRGYRIGYGGGYYDRFLARYPDLFTIGLAYDGCVAEKLPARAHDIPVNTVVTESRCFYFV